MTNTLVKQLPKTVVMALLAILAGCDSKVEIKEPVKAVTVQDPAAVQALEFFSSGEAFELSSQLRPIGVSAEQLLVWEKKTATALKKMKVLYGATTEFEFIDGVQFDLAQDEGQVGAIPFQMKIDVDQPSQFTMPFGNNDQAYIVLNAKNADGEQHLHILLWLDNEKWKIAEIAFTQTLVAGKNAEEIFLAGKDAANAAKLVDALALLSLADRMAETPKFRVSGLKNAIKNSASRIAAQLNHPPDPIGRYEVGDDLIDVTAINAVNSDGEFYLQIHNRVSGLIVDEEDIRTKQLALGAAFAKAQSTIREYYFGLGVSTVSTNPNAKGAGYRTVYSFKQIDQGDPTPPQNGKPQEAKEQTKPAEDAKPKTQ